MRRRDPHDPRYTQDPPRLIELSDHQDPPIEAWPGERRTEEDVYRASGHPKDWFRAGHRLWAHDLAWDEFEDARDNRRDFYAGFDWNQILIIGPYGAKKTTAAVHEAYKWFRLGHPVFSNIALTFGWGLQLEEIYTALVHAPSNSVFVIDDASSDLGARMAAYTAIDTFSQGNLNTRKKNAKFIYSTAHDWELAYSIRRECKEVWLPVDVVDAGEDDEYAPERTRPLNDPDNFKLGWHVWDGFPYQKESMILGQQRDPKEGFGNPSYSMYDEGDNVRMSYLLNDTFALVKPGGARAADTSEIRDTLRDIHAGKVAGGKRAKTPLEEEIVAYFMDRLTDAAEYFKPSELAAELDVSVQKIGTGVNRFLGLQRVRDKGYPSAAVFAKLEKLGLLEQEPAA